MCTMAQSWRPAELQLATTNKSHYSDLMAARSYVQHGDVDFQKLKPMGLDKTVRDTVSAGTWPSKEDMSTAALLPNGWTDFQTMGRPSTQESKWANISMNRSRSSSIPGIGSLPSRPGTSQTGQSLESSDFAGSTWTERLCVNSPSKANRFDKILKPPISNWSWSPPGRWESTVEQEASRPSTSSTSFKSFKVTAPGGTMLAEPISGSMVLPPHPMASPHSHKFLKPSQSDPLFSIRTITPKNQTPVNIQGLHLHTRHAGRPFRGSDGKVIGM